MDVMDTFHSTLSQARAAITLLNEIDDALREIIKQHRGKVDYGEDTDAAFLLADQRSDTCDTLAELVDDLRSLVTTIAQQKMFDALMLEIAVLERTMDDTQSIAEGASHAH